ncbi:DUF3558 family protein [Micromonospora sp. NPDC049060]|uniref:DUF3558 family protein n=1 Tax=Micromonospora sp. NPDC049060 TaxID=3154828 RepID=UPI0033CE2C1C
MKHRSVTLAALVAVCLTAGCDLTGSATAGDSPTADATLAPPAEAASPTPAGTADGDPGAMRGAGGLPDPCTLLTESEVVDLTGREVTRNDEDGGDAGDVTRFCQWQQDHGQLTIFLSRTTAADFDVTVAAARPVDGVGEKAYWHSGHLYVLHGALQIDVYSRGGSDAQNLADAEQVAKVVIPRV